MNLVSSPTRIALSVIRTNATAISSEPSSPAYWSAATAPPLSSALACG